MTSSSPPPPPPDPKKERSNKVGVKKFLILFQSKSSTGSFIGDSLKAKFQVYHLALRFNSESQTAYTLCDSREWINWATEFHLITPDEIPTLTRYGMICKECEQEARDKILVPSS
jgi:hypothetical protein